MIAKTLSATLLALLAVSTGVFSEESAQAAFSMGDGDENWIKTQDAAREGKTLTFKEVQINGNGWLVMHPFENGVANGDKYVAATYVESGINQDVDIEVYRGVSTGEMYIVMLHRDLNENGIFDFVFVDDTNVMDRAVFEGSKMIGHAFAAP
ncbi:MAG: hypothetical protein ACI8Z1_000223 [Candidatus Azotimanducaceae bacterium]|jgi:hypothetical protein